MALAVRQGDVKDSGTSSSQFTFGLTPIQGNLMIAIVAGYTGNGDAIVGTGWTLDEKNSNINSVSNYSVFWKYAGASESATQTPDTRSWTSVYVQFWEISGVSGTWATDHAATNHDLPNDSSQTSNTSTSHNTANNNALVLVGAWAQAGSGAMSLSGGQTNDGAQNGNAGGFNHCTANGHQAIATSGTAYQYTASWTGAVVNLNGIVTVELKPAAAPAETSTASLALTKVSFSATDAREETETASLALTKVSFHGAAAREETLAAALALSPVTIKASGIDLGTGGGVHFSTFGA